ncbi:hypothetical protein [Nocardia sp. CC227C]|uniref:hypothetical protein n=1 Tax=Nocardia sp. CC227C TaxID=3044562 RepID=UPI00278C27BF|nr:hypothetical protein [Nocardia sp. CC227C]
MTAVDAVTLILLAAILACGAATVWYLRRADHERTRTITAQAVTVKAKRPLEEIDAEFGKLRTAFGSGFGGRR